MKTGHRDLRQFPGKRALLNGAQWVRGRPSASGCRQPKHGRVRGLGALP
jgi:hypothetical protein